MSDISELLPIPQLQAASKIKKLVWWVTVFAILIALVLIIMSIYSYAKGNKSAGTGLLITGGILGLIAAPINYYSGRSLDSILLEQSKGGRFLKNILGKGEEFDETVVNVGGDCGCTTRGGDPEEFDEDVNELDYVESSDEDDENPYEDNKSETNESEIDESENMDKFHEILKKVETEKLSESDMQLLSELYKKLNEVDKKIADDLLKNKNIELNLD